MRFKKENKIEKNKDIDSTEKKKLNGLKSLMNMDLKELNKKLTKKNVKFKSFSREKKKKVVAFDIGTSTIKIVEGMYYKKELLVNKYIKIKTPQGAVIDGEIKREDELRNKLVEVLKENSVKVKHAVCTTNSTAIINREILIPKVEEDEMETVIRYEIQQYLPINLEDYVLQGTILSEKEIDGAKKLEVRVIAYPARIAKGYYKLLLKLDLKPYALDVNYNSINKFINVTGITNEFEHKSKESIAFIDLGASSIDVNIYKNGQLDFTRIIKDCGNEIDDMLIERNNLEISEIERFKLKNINLNEELEPVNIYVREIVDEWIEKIEKIIQFYKNRTMGNDVHNIIIFGGSSKLNGLEEYMTNKLGIKTKIKGISKMNFKSNDDGKPVDDFINVIGSIIRNS